MNCVIIEDEPLALGMLQKYVEKVPFLSLQATFRDALKALDHFQYQQTDLLFLDINMPDLSGIQLLKFLPQPPLIIFTTAYSQYALESYELNAIFLIALNNFKNQKKLINEMSI